MLYANNNQNKGNNFKNMPVSRWENFCVRGAFSGTLNVKVEHSGPTVSEEARR